LQFPVRIIRTIETQRVGKFTVFITKHAVAYVCNNRTFKMLVILLCTKLLTALSKAWACGRSLAENVGSNPAGSMDISIL
jgi:hypothetical protein